MRSLRYVLILPKVWRFTVLLALITLLWLGWYYFDSRANQSKQRYQELLLGLDYIKATLEDQPNKYLNQLDDDQRFQEIVDSATNEEIAAATANTLLICDIAQEILGKPLLLQSGKLSTTEEFIAAEKEAAQLIGEGIVLVGDYNSKQVGIFFSEDMEQQMGVLPYGAVKINIDRYWEENNIVLSDEKKQIATRAFDDYMSKQVEIIRQENGDLDNDQAFALIGFAVVWRTDIRTYQSLVDKRVRYHQSLAEMCQLATFPLALLALLILWSGFGKDFRWLVRQQMTLYGLDTDTTFQLLFRKFKGDWKNGKNLEALCKQLSRECARICRTELAQRKKLRQEANRELPSEPPPPVKQESFRVEVIELRRSTTETSTLQRVAESLFDRVLEQQAKKEEKSPRLALLHKIRGCAHNLRNIESVEIAQLTMLAQEIRNLKRELIQLSKSSWKKFCEVFDGEEPQTYSEILSLAQKKAWAEIELMLCPPQPEQAVAVPSALDWPQILVGKSVLLVGGDPYPFYTEQLLSLGARSVSHLTGGDNLKKLQNARADIVFFLYRRASHKLFDLASQVGEFIPIDKRGKSTFLPEVIEQYALYHSSNLAA